MDGVRVWEVLTEGDRNDPNKVYRWLEAELGLDGVRIFKRHAGEKAGSEYHTGANPEKNPERFFIAAGTLRFQLYDGREEETIDVDEGLEIQIDPWVWHATDALTDVTYVKPVYRGSGVKDTYRATKEEFRQVLQRERRWPFNE